MHQLNLQLYARTAKTDFNEQLSVRRTVTLTPDPERVELSLKAPGREKFVELRLDPDDKASQFVLHELSIRSTAGEELYSWDGDAQGLTGLVSLRAVRSGDEVILESNSTDPFLLIPLSSPQGSVSVHLCVSLAIGLGADHRELADAVRALQSSLRVAIDDLASEQEGLQDSLVLQQARARTESHEINEQLQSVLGRAEQAERSLRKLESDVVGMDASFAETVTDKTRRIRNEILAEIRDDWRSVRQQVAESAELALKQGRERDSQISAGLQEEFAKLIQAVRRVAGAEDVLKMVRNELGVARDDEVIEKLRRLARESSAASQRIQSIERSLSWRLTRPFRLLAGSSAER